MTLKQLRLSSASWGRVAEGGTSADYCSATITRGKCQSPSPEADKQRRSGRWRARSRECRGSMQAEVRSCWDGGGAGDRRGGRASWGLVGCSFGALWEWGGLAGGEQERRSLGTLYKEAAPSSFSPFVSSLLPLSVCAGVPVVPPQLAL